MPRPRSALLFCLSLCSLAVLVSLSISGSSSSSGVADAHHDNDNANNLLRAQHIHRPNLDRRQGNGTEASPTASSGGNSASTPVDTAITIGTTTAVNIPDTATSITTAITQTTPISETTIASQTAISPSASNSGTAASSSTSLSTAVSSAASSSGAATSSGTSAAASSTAGGSSTADAVSTVIITTTAADGSVITSASLSTAPAQTQSADTGNDDEPSNSKKWIIPLSVVGGIIVLAGVLFIGYRCTQRRFSELDDDGATGIRWPELLKRGDDYESAATLNPLGTKRRDGAAGIGFEMDETKGMSSTSLNETANGAGSANVGSGATDHFAAAGLGSAGTAINRSASSAGTTSPGYGGAGYSDQGHGGAMGGAYYAGPQQGYYDPYLGASGAPYPPPQRILSPQNAGPNPYYDPYAQAQPHQQGPPQGQPYYPPRSVSPFAAGGGGSGPASRSGTPPVGMPGHRPPSVPLEQHPHHAYQDQQTESLDFTSHAHQQQHQQQQYDQGMYAPAASPTHSQGPNQPVGNRGLMRLSIANPED